MTMAKRLTLALGISLLMLLAACGPDDPALQPSDSDNGEHGMDMEDDRFAFGQPGHEGDAERVIEVSALDSLEFDPASLNVEAGETITFVVTNDGKNVHEFVIGDETYQQEHAADMARGEHVQAVSNQVEVAPGETETLVWTFSGAGDVLYGCHEPGHYEGGMVGTIEVDG